MLLGLALGLTVVLPAMGGELEGIEIVAWTGYVGEVEWENLRHTLEGAGGTIVETDTRDHTELSVSLEGADVLLLPEQAQGFLVELEEVGSDLAPALHSFLRDGKRIVALTWASGGEDILRGAGLTTADDGRDVSEKPLLVLDSDDRLATGIPGEFIAPESTTDFSMVDADATDVITTEDRASVVFRLHRDGGEVVLLGFDLLDPVEASEQLVINACWPGIPIICEQLLRSGIAIEGTLEPAARWETAQEQYGLEVHPDSHYMLVELEGDLDLHLRRDNPVEFDHGQAVADLSLLGPGGHLMLLSADKLGSGRVCFAIENPTDAAQTYRLVAWSVPDLEEMEDFPFETTGKLGPLPLRELNRFVETADGYLALAQYRVAVADGNESLSLIVRGEDIRAYIRHGEPVTNSDGVVEADLMFTESITLSGPFLVPGVYYIAIEGLTPPQTYEIEGEME
ncbi:MAG: hypothetical protein R6U88_06765 [Candidatus Bipolaricaulota bacterium]